MTNTAPKTAGTPTVEQPTDQEPRQLPQWSVPRVLGTLGRRGAAHVSSELIVVTGLAGNCVSARG
jgi:hypothetical protein